MILLHLSLSLWLDHHSSMHKLYNQLILTDETKTSLHSDMQSLLEMDALSSWNPTNKYCILFLLLCSLEQKGKAKLSFKEFNLMDIGDMLEYWFSPIYLA